ncbi:MAG: LamG-like jellyroll fold domain-containing protein, partial [Pyrinomonadaceae bacterium]
GCGQRINLAVHNGSGSYSDFSSDQIAIRPNTWHHFAVVRSTTAFTFYFDGVAVGTRSVGAGYALNGGSTGAILGARYNTSPSDRFEFANGMLDEISIYQRAVTGNEIGSVYNAGVAGKIKTKTTLAGTEDTTQISDATVTFANVTIGGYISQNGIDLGLMPTLPPNTTFTGLAYNISTTAAYQNGNADDVRVCFNLPALSAIGAGGLRLLHLESGNWIDRTASGNSLSNFCSDNLSSLSPFVIVEGTAPSSYGISGRVTTGGNGLANVLVTLSGDESSTATTNANGDYSFGSLNGGGNFTVIPSLAGYSFDPINRNYNALSENVSNAHFTAALMPTVSISDVTVTEGDSGSVNANFNVTLSTAYVNDVTVFYSSYGGTATGGVDYTSVGSSVTFIAGETAKVVSVPVLGDTLDETNETFSVFLSSVVNATVLDGDATGTITDNDEPQCVTAPTGRVATFKGENTSTDSQGANNGSVNGTVTYSAGKVGQSFNFGDTGANVSVPDSPSLRPDSFTIEGWFNFTNYSNEFRMLLNKPSADPSYSSYNLFIYGGALNAQSTDGSNLGNTLYYTLNPVEGQWYHIAFTRQAGGQMTLYVNGVAVDSQASNPSVGYTNSPLTFGNSYDASLQGKIDELSIYDRALTGSEIQSVFNANTAGICPTGQCVSAPADQTVWYRGEGNANDSQGTGNGAGFNGVTYTAGKVGQAFDLPDGNAHVQVPDSAALRPTNFTVEGWFNFSSYNNEFRQLIGKSSADPSYSSYVIYIYGGLLTASSTNGVDLGNSLNYSLAPIPGQWYHIAFTRQEGGSQTLYVNGEAVDSDTANSIAYANTPLILGHDTGGSIHGKIDEVSIFGRAMSAVEIQSIYTAGGAGKCPNGACVTAPADLQSWYRFQGNTSDVFNLHPAGAQGNPTYVAGRVGQAINLDGADDSVDLGSWFNYQTFSISMWINVAPFSEQPTFANIIDNNHTGGTNWVMQRVANENRYAFGDNSGGEVFFVPTPNTWQHLTVIRDPTAGIKVYLDGTLVGEDTTVGTIPYNGAQFLRLGRWGGGGRHLKGKVDELDIYPRVLTPTEITSMYSAGSAGKCVPPQCAETPANQVTTFKAENNANDSQGTNNGTANGGVTYASGKVGQAFNFGDTSANVSVPDSPSLRPDSFTIEGWFNFTGYSNEFRSLLNKPSADPSYSSYSLYIYGGLLNAQSTDGANLGNSLSHGLYPTPGQWYHIAFTRLAGGQMKLYVNGVEVDSQASNASVGYSSSPLTFSNGTDAANQGKIDEISIYNRALSAPEIQSIVDADSVGKCTTLGCDAADYQFNDDLTSTIPGALALSYIGTGQTFATETVNGVPERVMTYTGGNAVELRPTSGVIPSNQYEITIVTRLNQNYNYNRILDFKDGTTDSGLYVTSGQLIFLPGGNGGPVIPPGVYVEIKLTRTAAGIVKGYVNGVEQFSFNDTGNNAVISATNALRFFKDDGGEHYGGAIARIQLSAGGCGSTHSISGNIDNGTSNMSGVSVTISGGTNASTTTDANGNYTFANLPSGLNYIVTPTLANHTFTPPTRTYNTLAADMTDADFTGANSCTFSLSPDNANFTAAGGSGSFNVTTQPGCQWTAAASSNIAPWVTINGASSGTGNGTVNYTVEANTSILRYGDVLINGAISHFIGQETGMGTCPTVTPVTYGTTLNGALAVSDCDLSGRYTDQFSFSGTVGDRVLIRLSSSDFAESLILHNQANTAIYTFTTGGAANDARIPNSYGFYTLPATGTYIISASNWGNGGSPTGNYTLSLHSDRTVPGVTPPSGLIGWYAGEGDTRNQQGNSPGTFNGTATYLTDYAGQSFSMNGTDRYVEVPSASESFNVSSISVEAWVNTTTLSGDPNTPSPRYRTIASKFNGNGAASWSLDMEEGGAITFYVYDGSSNTYRGVRTVGAAAFLTANEWKHVAATFDQTTQEIRLFINGSDAGQLVAGSANSISGIGQNSSPLRIGSYNNGSSVMGYWQGRLDEVSIYNRAITHDEVKSIIDAGRIGKIKSAAINNQTTATLGTSTINFAVATTGTATETPIDGAALPAPLPVGQALHLAFNISTNAPFTGNATVCFAVPTVTPAEFADLKVYHLEAGVWVDRTAPGNVYPTLCSLTPSFSPFAIAKPLVPSSSTVSVSGRVLTANGQGIKNTILSLSLADGTVVRTRSSSFGYYRFDNVESGQSAVLSIHSKRYTFAQPNRVISISDDLTSVDFIAEP